MAALPGSLKLGARMTLACNAVSPEQKTSNPHPQED